MMTKKFAAPRVSFEEDCDQLVAGHRCQTKVVESVAEAVHAREEVQDQQGCSRARRDVLEKSLKVKRGRRQLERK
jgi:hypothetical protein